MPEALVALGSIGAGALCSASLLAVGRQGPSAAAWTRRLKAELVERPHVALARRRWARMVARAGWNQGPERVAVLAAAFALSLAVLAGAASPALTLPAFVVGCAVCLIVLNSSIVRRRRRFSAELVPLLELFTLELSAGGSPLAALGSVSVQVESELAHDLRRMLIASQVTGSASFESRLIEYSEAVDLAALGSLATILAASRDYGTAASQGVRALATDLRRAQRRELIAQSRRALNNVLLPSAVAVLLPFLGVLMFPAVSVLQGSLR
ncbi:MAG: hypothetical protein ABI334_00265 [Candidatus Dormiibacterota bacterium]